MMNMKHIMITILMLKKKKKKLLKQRQLMPLIPAPTQAGQNGVNVHLYVEVAPSQEQDL